MVRLAVKGDCPRAIHRLQVVLDLETRGAVLPLYGPPAEGGCAEPAATAERIALVRIAAKRCIGSLLNDGVYPDRLSAVEGFQLFSEPRLCLS